jgi:hypothetical protein
MAIKNNKSKKSKNKPVAKKATPKKGGRTKATKAKTTATKPKTKAVKPLLPKDLETRLFGLARQMEKTMDALMLQALCEFADAWEDHFRTVKSLQDDGRIVLSVTPE